MTERELQFLEKVREDPKHPVFNSLFFRNIHGVIERRSEVSFTLMPDGIPMIWDNATSDLFPINFTTANSAQPVSSGKSFREISNEIALQGSFGEESIFFRKEREILKGQIPKL
jgi:hypothetical protein